MAPDERVASLAVGRRRRLVAVYRATGRILLSYLGLRLLALVRDPETHERALSRFYHRSARRLRDTILEVQGLFIKVGQLMSVLTSVLPAEFRDDLAGLQDRIPPRPLAEIDARLRRELGADPAALFAELDPRPIASASLAQVHAARLADGRRVAVKVQHLDIEELARLDLATIGRLLRIVQAVFRVRGLAAAFEEVRQMILGELDFTREGEHLETIAANFAGDPMVSFPEVIRERSSRGVLTTTFVDGVKISDREALVARGLALEAVAERVVRAYCQMIFVDGIFHADPHPGNLFVRDDGGLVFVDFGAVSCLSPGLKDGIPRFLEGVLRRDRDEILQALRTMGFVRRGPAGDPFDDPGDTAERVIDYFFTRFLEQIELESWNLADLKIDSRMKLEMLADLSRLDVSLRELTAVFQVPREFALLQRTLVLLMGVATDLHPTLRPVTILRPYLEEFVLGKDRDWMGLVTKAVKDMALSALTVPGELRGLLAQARRGDARFEVRGLREGASLLYALGHQLLYGGFALGTGALAYLAAHRGDEDLALGLAAAGAAALLLLAGSMIKARRWQKALRRRTPRR